MERDSGTLAAAALAALQRDDVAEARRICASWLALSPGNANALLLSGIAAYRAGHFEEAISSLTATCEQAPAAAQGWQWLGHSLRRLGRLNEAVVAYRRALDIAPTLADVATNLALSCHGSGDDVGAGAAATHWGRLEPAEPEACQRVIDAASRLAKAGVDPPPAVRPVATMPSTSFIVCSITPSKLEAVRCNIAERMAGHDWELIAITDAKSLCEAYNRGARRARGDVVVFCHDDIEILDEEFASRLAAALEGADVVGVWGTTRVTGPAVAWSGRPHVHGWVTHLAGAAGFLPSICSLAPPQVDRAEAIDGLFMAMHRRVLDRVTFDAERFDGFHFYDLDFSYRAFLAGFRLRIQCDLLLTHASTGGFNASYWRFAHRFASKFPQACTRAESGDATFFQARTDSREETRRVFRWIGHWLGSCPIPMTVT